MKSLFIVNDFPPIKGGQSTYLYNLCRALPQDKFIVLAPQVSGDHAFDQMQDFQIIRKKYLFPIPILEKIFKIVLPMIYTQRIMQREEIGILHCAHVLSTGFIGLIFKKIKNQPYYLYTHSADILEYQNNSLIKFFLRKIINNANRIVTNSEFTKVKLLELGASENKIIKIYPRIDYQQFSKAIDVQDFLEHYHLAGKKIVLSVNRLVPRKGNDMVIRAFKQVITEIPNAVYLIAGEGPCLSMLKDLVASLNLNQHVMFLGAPDNNLLNKLYHLCNLFIMSSRELDNGKDVEGFGIVFLEANSAGKAVIGGNTGGIPDAVIDGQTGILVDPESTIHIAQAIIKLLKDEEYARQLGQKGRQRVKEEFDWRSPIKELDFLFNDHDKN